MEFSYETQGANSFLVYNAGIDDEIDSMTLGMIINNKISGFAPSVYTQVDDKRYIKYNISSRVSADQIFAGIVNKEQLLGVFLGISEALIYAEDYMIPLDNVVLDLKYIFVEVSTYNTVLICVPQVGYKNKEDFGMFLKNILFNTRFDENEDSDYVARIISFLNKNIKISATEFKELIISLKNDANIKTVNANTTVNENVKNNAVNEENQEYINYKNIQNQQNFNGGQGEAEYDNRAENIGRNNEPKNTNEAKNVNTNIVPKIKKSPQGFAIPGMQQEQKINIDIEKSRQEKMSLGYLLMHYSAENKAKYKALKESADSVESNKKTKKSKKKKVNENIIDKPSEEAVNNQYNPISIHQNEMIKQQNIDDAQLQQSQELTHNQAIPQQPIRPVTPQQPVKRQMVIPQHMNVQPSAVPQNQQGVNFGETTVLSAAASSDTTVLNQSMLLNNSPYLIRKKTGERIQIDKPVFRLGKENSYVDYFIGDNSAISRSHANIITKENKYYIIDTNSTNHTFIEGQMIPPNRETEITSGQMIKLANEEFEFHIG